MIPPVEEAPKGSVCQRKGCGKAKEDVTMFDDVCVFHAGCPVFHEG